MTTQLMKTRTFFLAIAMAALLCSCSGKREYLLTGSSLDGWKVVLRPDSTVVEDTFTASDGVLHITGQPFGYIRTEKKYSDYKLHLEWRWAAWEAVDGGIFNRLQDGDKVWPTGIQVQMTPEDMGLMMGGIPLKGVEGPFYRKARIVAESPEKPVGEWNEMEFLCKGESIKVWLNGIMVNEVVAEATDGYIGFQSEGGAMDIRDIWITPIR